MTTIYALSSCFISAACFSAVPENSNFFLHLFVHFSSINMLFFAQVAKDNSMAMIWWLGYIKTVIFQQYIEFHNSTHAFA